MKFTKEQIVEWKARKEAAKMRGDNIHKLAEKIIIHKPKRMTATEWKAARIAKPNY